MSTRNIKAGTTDVSVVIRIIDSADGTPETGVVFNTSGIDLWYRREGAASVDITEATLSALTDAHSDGGFLHINDGWYRLDLPDAACGTGVTGVQIGGTVTGMVVLAPYIQLVAYDPYDTVRLGLTALPNVASGNSGAIPTVGTGTAQISVSSGQVILQSGTGTGQLDFTSGVVKSSLVQILGTALTETSGQIAAAFKKFFDKSSPTGTINSIPDAVAGASGGLLIAGTNAPVTITGSGNALTLTSTGGNGHGLAVSGNGSGEGLSATGGATGNGIQAIGGATSGSGLYCIATTSGAGIAGIAAGNNNGIEGDGAGSGAGLAATGGASGDGFHIEGQGSSHGMHVVADSGNGFNFTVTSGGDIVGDITGSLSGSVGSVTGAVGSVTGAVGSVTGAVGSVTGNVGGNVVGSVASVSGAVGSVTGNVGGNVTGSIGSLATQAKADVNAEADTALSDYDPPTRSELTTDTNSILSKLLKYFQLLFRKDSAIATDNATEVTAINANGGSGAGAFANTTDSTEAIRDRGDAAWTTATGFSTHTAADVWAVATRVLTAGTNIALAKGTGVTGFTDIDAAGVRTAVGLASANLDTQLDALPTAAENAAALMDLSNGVETSITPRQALRIMLAAMAGKLSGAATTTITIRNVGDSKDRITATVTADGDRTAVTVDGT